MKRSSTLLAAFLVLTFILSACSPAQATTAPVLPTATSAAAQSGSIEIKDALGTEFKLDQPAQKIISLAPSNTEFLYALGAGAQIIGRDDFSNFPDAANQLVKLGGSSGKYDLEKITSLKPDLILVSSLNSADQIKAFQAITPNVFEVGNPLTMDDLYITLANLGKLTGHQTEATKMVADLQARVKVVTDKVATAAKHPKVFYELDGSDPAKPWTAGKGSFIDLLITMAGGENAAAKMDGAYAQISQEELIVQNPDFVLLGDALYGGVKPEQVAARPGWNVIQAVKANQVVAFNDDLVSRPGPRLVDGLEAIARQIHPELFK